MKKALFSLLASVGICALVLSAGDILTEEPSAEAQKAAESAVETAEEAAPSAPAMSATHGNQYNDLAVGDGHRGLSQRADHGPANTQAPFIEGTDRALSLDHRVERSPNHPYTRQQ